MLVTQDHMNFTNSTPLVWMKKEREIILDNLPDSNLFIIVNPEEIGMSSVRCVSIRVLTVFMIQVHSR